MADISKLNLNDSLYNVKDSTARSNVTNLQNSLGTASQKDYATVAIGATGEDVNALPSVGQVEAYVSNKVTGAMHFKGVAQGNELPAPADYDAGDVIIWQNKEYVCYANGGIKAWEQLGDESTLYATQTELRQVEGVGWTSANTVQGNADGISNLNTTVGGHTTSIGSLSDRVDALESAPASTITSANIQTWNSKQAAIADGSATIASLGNDNVVTIKNTVLQSNGAIATDSTAADDISLAPIAKTGAASDLLTDATHRLVTDAQIEAWTSGASAGLIKSVDVEFNVDNDGKLEFASGYNALTDAQSTKLAGISDGANQVTVPNEQSGTLSIDGVSKNIALPNTVQDANYRHIDVTESSVTAVATGSSAAVTFNKYVHPAGSGASLSTGLYKFSTDSTSHVSGATAVTGSDIAGYLSFITAYDATNNKIATAADVAGGVHFKGVYASLEDIDFTPANGDLVVVGTKEYIFSEDSSEGWVPLGDEIAWDTKGSAAQALASAQSYADGKITALSGSASADSGYALTSVSESNGVISKVGQIKIPTDNAELTNGASYVTTSEMNTAINNAIFGAIDTVYTAA